MKYCPKCKQELEDDKFTRSPTTGKLQCYCKICMLQYDKERKEKRLAYFKNYNAKASTREREKQRYINRTQEQIEKDKIRHRGYYNNFLLNATQEQKEEKKLKSRIWYQQNKNKALKQKKEYREEHREEILAKQRAAYERDKDKIKQRNEEPNRKLNKAMARGIYETITSAKGNRHWEELVPYTFEDLKKYLESQFTPEMSWENYTEYWEIDHIIPKGLFNFTSEKDREFQICWSLMNLRPLEWKANRCRPKDGSDISDEVKQKILNQFLEEN